MPDVKRPFSRTENDCRTDQYGVGETGQTGGLQRVKEIGCETSAPAVNLETS
jgi:hypothetical protein